MGPEPGAEQPLPDHGGLGRAGHPPADGAGDVPVRGVAFAPPLAAGGCRSRRSGGGSSPAAGRGAARRRRAWWGGRIRSPPRPGWAGTRALGSTPVVRGLRVPVHKRPRSPRIGRASRHGPGNWADLALPAEPESDDRSDSDEWADTDDRGARIAGPTHGMSSGVARAIGVLERVGRTTSRRPPALARRRRALRHGSDGGIMVPVD